MNKTLINDKDFQTIQLADIEICRLCLKASESQPLLSVCECKGAVRKAHMTCLADHVKKTQSDRCAVCKSLYKNDVQIQYIAQSFCTFFWSKDEVFMSVFVGSLVYSFLYYILYLAVMDFILSDGLVNRVLRMLLIVPTVFYGIVFSICVIVSVGALQYKYTDWRDNNHIIVVKLNPIPEATKTTGAKESVETANEDQKNGDKRVTNTSAENQSKDCLKIQIESNSHHSNQTLEVNVNNNTPPKVVAKAIAPVVRSPPIIAPSDQTKT